MKRYNDSEEAKGKYKVANDKKSTDVSNTRKVPKYSKSNNFGNLIQSKAFFMNDSSDESEKDENDNEKEKESQSKVPLKKAAIKRMKTNYINRNYIKIQEKAKVSFILSILGACQK